MDNLMICERVDECTYLGCEHIIPHYELSGIDGGCTIPEVCIVSGTITRCIEI